MTAVNKGIKNKHAGISNTIAESGKIKIHGVKEVVGKLINYMSLRGFYRDFYKLRGTGENIFSGAPQLIL